jgi:metal-dependent amidase/aminoacylase/carboxypeptidase family protein
MGISTLRQQLAPDLRIHGIITHGGEAPNIIPEYTAAKYLVRANRKSDAVVALEKVENCARAGALAAGAEVKLTRSDLALANMLPNPVLADLFDANMATLGREVKLPAPDEPKASTDMGNVSHLVPTIHPVVQIAPAEVAGHSPEFRAAAASPEGFVGMLDAAQAMAMTAIDLFLQPELVEKAWKEHKARLSET